MKLLIILTFLFSCQLFRNVNNESVGSEIFEETGNLDDGDVDNNNDYSQTCVFLYLYIISLIHQR